MRKLRLSRYLLLLFFSLGIGCGGSGSSSSSSGSGGSSQNPVPTLSAISPNTGTAGGAALTITATGSNFISSSVVEWNGTALATTYASSTSVQAQVPATDLAATGTANVTVNTPAPGGGTSSKLTFTINPVPNPVPTVSSLSPSSAIAGSAAFTLTVTGTNFISSSQVLWNGSPRTTTFVSSTSLTAQILASDVSAIGTAGVSVQNPAPGGGTSSSLSFDISLGTTNPTNLTTLPIAGNDVAWNPAQKKLYLAVPSTSTTNGRTITVVDPIAGSIVSSQSLASEPYGLAISDDYTYLYTAINGGNTVQRLTLPALTPDIQWSLGSDPFTGNPYLAGDMKVQPGNAHTLAVSFDTSTLYEVTVFDDGVQRSGVTSLLGNSLQWNSAGTELYDAYGAYLDAPETTGSTGESSVYTLSVSASGVTQQHQFPNVFRADGERLHFDPNTGNFYSDWGEVVNASTGVPVGNYRFYRPSVTYFAGAFAAEDSTLQRFYILLEVQEPDNTFAFQIQAFDLTNFQLLSTIVIPNAVGVPGNFIRWGQSGLAIVTSASSGPGMLYLLDGAFVNPSGVQDTSAGTPIDPVPTLASISPTTATVGAGTVNLTVTGHDFTAASTIYWNGNALPTTLVNNSEAQAQIPASGLTAVAQATITASNAASGIPVSNSLVFSVDPAPPTGNRITVYSTGGNDLVWDANAARIYVSMPGSQGDQGDSIGVVDPVAGTVTNTGFLGSDPANLSISSDGNYLYTALYGQNAIQQLTLPNFKVNNSWKLGFDSFSGPYYALSLQAAPQAPQTTAVALANFNISPSSAGVVIYDGATPRSTELLGGPYPYSTLQWAASDTTIYAADQGIDFLVLGVSPSGVALDQHYNAILNTYPVNIHYDAGTSLIYTDSGQVIQPSNGTIVGQYGSSGITVPDSTLDRVFILGQTSAQVGTSNYTIDSFDQTKFTAIGSITIDNVVGTPTALIRWGTNGLAFTTRVGNPWDFIGTGPGQLYVISGSFVNPSDPSANEVPVRAQTSPVHRTWGWSKTSAARPRPSATNPLGVTQK